MAKSCVDCNYVFLRNKGRACSHPIYRSIINCDDACAGWAAICKEKKPKASFFEVEAKYFKEHSVKSSFKSSFWKKTMRQIKSFLKG